MVVEISKRSILIFRPKELCYVNISTVVTMSDKNFVVYFFVLLLLYVFLLLVMCVSLLLLLRVIDLIFHISRLQNMQRTIAICIKNMFNL